MPIKAILGKQCLRSVNTTVVSVLGYVYITAASLSISLISIRFRLKVNKF